MRQKLEVEVASQALSSLDLTASPPRDGNAADHDAHSVGMASPASSARGHAASLQLRADGSVSLPRASRQPEGRSESDRNAKAHNGGGPKASSECGDPSVPIGAGLTEQELARKRKQAKKRAKKKAKRRAKAKERAQQQSKHQE